MNDKVILPLLRIDLNKGVYNGHIHYIRREYKPFVFLVIQKLIFNVLSTYIIPI